MQLKGGNVQLKGGHVQLKGANVQLKGANAPTTPVMSSPLLCLHPFTV